MESEDKIKQLVGKRNPFTVPKGYFKSFEEELMSKLPEQAPKRKTVTISLWERVKPWAYMAACFAAITWSINFWTGGKENFNSQNSLESAQAQLQDLRDEDASYYLASTNEYLLYEAVYEPEISSTNN